MSEWPPESEEFLDSPQAGEVEELLLWAAEDPPVRSGMKAETITLALRARRLLSSEHRYWAAAAWVLLLIATLCWWPSPPGDSVALDQAPKPDPVAVPARASVDALDWELVEAKTQLRRRNLEILLNAF